MPAPSLEETCRALIQNVRGAVAAAASSRPVLVAMHTSVDVRQATTDAHPGDPALLTFPCVLLGVPTLVEDLDRRHSLGFSVYRNRNLLAKTIQKEPYPRFYDLVFKVQVKAERLAGDAALFSLLQALTAWAQQSPRVLGLFAEWRTTFVPDEASQLGDVESATGNIRLRDWPCYGGPPADVKLVETTKLDIISS
jgi:hypothetical protein